MNVTEQEIALENQGEIVVLYALFWQKLLLGLAGIKGGQLAESMMRAVSTTILEIRPLFYLIILETNAFEDDGRWEGLQGM